MQISYLNSNLFCFRRRKVKIATLTLTFYSGGEENIRRRRISFFWRRKKEKEKDENIWKRSFQPKIVKDIEKSRPLDFCQLLEGFGIGFGEFGLGKKVSVWVSENSVSEKSISFGFENLVSEKKVSVSVSVKILVSSFSGPSYKKH